MAKRKCTLSLISDLTSPINISLLKLITISFLSEWILYHELVRKLLHKTSSNLNALCEYTIRMAMLYFIVRSIEIIHCHLKTLAIIRMLSVLMSALKKTVPPDSTI